MMGMSRSGRSHNLFKTGPFPAVADIIANSAVEQPGILQDHAEHGAQIPAPHIPDIHPVYSDDPSLHLVKAHDQVNQCGLAGPGRAHYSHGLPGLDLDAQILHQQGIFSITEFDMLETHLTPGKGNDRRILAVGPLLLFIQDLENPLRRSDSGLQDIGDIGHLNDGMGELTHILDKGLHIPDEDSPLRHQEAPHQNHQNVADVIDEIYGRKNNPRHELGLPAHLVEPLVDLPKLLHRIPFMPKHLDDFVPAVHLLHMAVQLAQDLLLLCKKTLRIACHYGGYHCAQRQGHYSDQCHQGADGKHHHQNTRQRHHRGNQLCQALLQRIGDIVHIIGYPAQYLAMGLPVEIA